MRTIRPLLVLLLTAAALLPAQIVPQDPCGYPESFTEQMRAAASIGWGYGYDTLLYDLSQWKKSPYVKVDSVGASVQGRTLFLVTIQDSSADPQSKRQRVWIHARTHPNEVQGTWVTNEMVKYLLAESDTARLLRTRYLFTILPMYNPDGVQLGNLRENANGIDIEGNWNAASPQKEVLVLRGQFQKAMAAPNPMRIMLNMHSAYACTRYFVYHAPGGTSTLFSLMEQRFINGVRVYVPGAIEPYPYYTSWTSAPATQYPESWCWANHKEKIMAMTYEDGNCTAASDFDRTARAILLGINDYLQDTTSVLSVAANTMTPREHLLEQNYPNPFNPSTVIRYRVPVSGAVRLSIHDVLGREVAVPVDEVQEAGVRSVTWDASPHATGIYLYRLTAGGHSDARTMLYLK